MSLVLVLDEFGPIKQVPFPLVGRELETKLERKVWMHKECILPHWERNARRLELEVEPQVLLVLPGLQTVCDFSLEWSYNIRTFKWNKTEMAKHYVF